MNELKNYSQYISYQIINSCKKAGYTHAVISPGLRCAPIIKAVTLCGLETISCIDERAAGYYALGLFKAKKIRSILICTSGTAALNYLPALAEGFKTNIPLLIISADRPLELIKKNSNQTIDQINPFTPFLGAQFSISDLRDKQYDHLQKALSSKEPTLGPMHINLHLSEPVDEQVEEYELNSFTDSTNDIALKKEPVSEYHEIIQKLQKAKNPLFVVGSGIYTNEEIKSILSTKIPTVLDITSGHKATLLPTENLTPSFDHPEIRKFYKKNPPDLVIKFGQYVITKHLGSLRLDKEGILYQEKVSNNQEICIESKHRHTFIKDGLMSSLKSINREDLKHISWEALSNQKREHIDNFGLTFPYISKNFLDKTKTTKTIVLGNSTIVRSFDYYIPNLKGPSHRIITNRGVSGIEGFTMMSKAVADALESQVIVFNGDISFLHDLNSLQNIKHSKGSIIYFLLNNQCGGIFNSIPIQIDEKSKPFITTNHNTNFEKVIKSFGINYQCISTCEEYLDLIDNIDMINETIIIECKINDQNNINLFKFLRTLSN